MQIKSPLTNPWGTVVPAVALCLLFFLMPIINMVALSLNTPSGFGLENFYNFFATEHLRSALQRSAFLAFSATLISSLLAWPLAYYIVFCADKKWRPLLLLMLLAPFWTSFTIRAFSWQLVLSDNGVIAWLVNFFLGININLGFLYTISASIFGLALFGTMLTTFTLYGALIAIQRNLLEAAANLGATPFKIFRDIVLPLGMRGWLAGITLTFIVCVGDYAVPTLLGGGLKPVLAQIMLSVLKGTYDLPRAATMAIILTLTVIVSTLPFLLIGYLSQRR